MNIVWHRSAIGYSNMRRNVFSAKAVRDQIAVLHASSAVAPILGVVFLYNKSRLKFDLNDFACANLP